MGTPVNSETFSKERGFKLISWNIRSLYSKFNEFEANVDTLQPEVISICESWLSDKIPDDRITLQNYSLFRHDRCIKRRGGGLCIYVKNKYICNSSKYNHLNFSNNDLELMTVKICLPSTTPIIIINC